MATLAEVNALEEKIKNATNYINNVSDPTKKAGAQAKLDEYIAQHDTAFKSLVDNGEIASAPAATVKPTETGNVAVDSANVLSSILNSPLYTQTIKDSYLSTYLPGLTQATYDINKARADEVQNAFNRQQAQAAAIREIAGNYAARGMRTPKMVSEGFAPVQQNTEQAKKAAEDYINQLVANKEVLYGAGATSAESFITDPALYGSVGAGARRSALSELQALPDIYGLKQVESASSSPLKSNAGSNYTPPADVRDASGLSVADYEQKIANANKYISSQTAAGNTATVAGATTKLNDYQAKLDALKSARGY